MGAATLAKIQRPAVEEDETDETDEDEEKNYDDFDIDEEELLGAIEEEDVEDDVEEDFEEE